MHITGHRGQVVSGGPAENTLPAVAAALDGGAGGVEVDVRLTLDGVPVCVHDASLLRVTGRPAYVHRLRYDELVTLPAGCQVARLHEVAHLVLGRGLLVVEIKHDADRSPPAAPVLRALSGYDARELVVSSFSAVVLADVRRQRRDVRTALVTGPEVPAAYGLAAALAGEHDELHAHLAAVLADHEVAERAERAGRVVRCWTVNREVDARLLEVAGVAGVICDDPVRLVAALAAAESLDCTTSQA